MTTSMSDVDSDVAHWIQRPLGSEERALISVQAWGRTEDWSDWGVDERSDVLPEW